MIFSIIPVAGMLKFSCVRHIGFGRVWKRLGMMNIRLFLEFGLDI